MYVGIFDTINSIIQSILFIVPVNCCIEKKYKNSKTKLFLFIVIYWISITFFTIILGNYSLTSIIIHIITLIIVMICYRKTIMESIIVFNIMYILFALIAIISLILYQGVIEFLPNLQNNMTIMVLFLYFPSYILSILILKNNSFVQKLYKVVNSRISSIFLLIIITIIFDFVISVSLIFNDKDNPIFKEIIFIILAIFIVFITLYFERINKKANEINLLNKELEKKINELKKIKHDYGSQISYLYGAYLMNDYEKLCKLLKDIINGHDISLEIKVLTSKDSIISRVINTTNLKEVNLLIDEKANLNEADINEMDLQKIISNIVRNSVDVLNGNGLLMIKTYYSYNSIVLLIQNNGPKINSKIIDKIFEQGFSTKKDNVGDNGFGLYIVKELVNKYKGSVIVDSNDDKTSFEIKLPLKQRKNEEI